MKLSFTKKKNSVDKAINPSERESITEFTTHFGSGRSYERRLKRRRVYAIIGLILGVVLCIALGYYFTETAIDISELPVA